MLTKWAEQYHSTVIHIHRQIRKFEFVCAFVYVLQGVFFALLCKGQGDKPTAGPLIKGAHRFICLSIAVCLARRVGVSVCVC